MPEIVDFLLGFNGPTCYFLVFLILLACGFGVPIPEDITLIAGGVLSYYGTTNVYIMIVVGLLGVLIGDSSMFWLGRRFGSTITSHKFIARLMPADRLDQVREVLHKRGIKILFAARFMPGLRSPLFFSAGTLGIPFRIFLFYDGMAALVSVPAIVYSVYYFGHDLERVILTIQRANYGIISVIAAIALVFAVRWFIAHRRKKASEASVT